MKLKTFVVTGIAALLIGCGAKEVPGFEYNSLTNVAKREISYSQLTDQEVYDSAVRLEQEAMDKNKELKESDDPSTNYKHPAWTEVANKLVSAAARYDWVIENSNNDSLKHSADVKSHLLRIDPIAQVYGDGSVLELSDKVLVFSDKETKQGNDKFNGIDVDVEAYEPTGYGKYRQIDLQPGKMGSGRTMNLESDDYSLLLLGL